MCFLLNQFCLVEGVKSNWLQVKSGLHVFVIALELKVLTVFSTWQGCYKNFKFPVHAIFAVLFKNTRTLKIKSNLHNCIFCHQSLQSQAMSLETLVHTKQIEIHQSKTMTFWTRWSKFLFPKRSSKMIDSSKKRKRQWAFELWNSCVFEKRSNRQGIEQLVLFSSSFLSK